MAGTTPQRPEREAFRVRLPGFVNEEDVGLGDVVTRFTTAVGIKPCGGCKQRARALNALVVFSGRQR